MVLEVMGITIFNNILRLFFMLATVTTSKTTNSSSGGSMSTPSVSPCRQLGQDLHKVTFSLDSCKCCNVPQSILHRCLALFRYQEGAFSSFFSHTRLVFSLNAGPGLRTRLIFWMRGAPSSIWFASINIWIIHHKHSSSRAKCPSSSSNWVQLRLESYDSE